MESSNLAPTLSIDANAIQAQSPNELAANCTILTIDEFALFFKVSRTTVFKWIKEGKLRPRRHFFKLDGVIRFPLRKDLIDKLLEDSQDCEVVNSDKTVDVRPKTQFLKPLVLTKSRRVNRDY